MVSVLLGKFSNFYQTLFIICFLNTKSIFVYINALTFLEFQCNVFERVLWYIWENLNCNPSIFYIKHRIVKIKNFSHNEILLSKKNHKCFITTFPSLPFYIKIKKTNKKKWRTIHM